jgi:hypothetical protein
VAATLARLLVELGMDASGFSRGINQAKNEITGVADHFAAAGARMRDVGTKAFAGLTLPIVGFAGVAVNAASDLAEAQSAVTQVYGESAAAIVGYAGSAAGAIGLSRQEALSAAAQFGVFGAAAGLTGDDMAAFSNDVIGAAADLASFYNVPVPEALAAIRSGLTGETEPLRRFGIMLNQAELEAYALSAGIWDGTGAMTEQQKVLARHGYFMTHLGAAQDDFQRTSGGLANRMRIVQARFKDVAAVVGQELIPVAEKLVGWVEAGVKWFERLSPETRRWGLIVAGVVAALGPLLIFLGFVASGIGALVGLGSLLAGAFLPVLVPLALAAAAVAALALAFGVGFGDILRWVQAAKDAVAPFVGEVVSTFNTLRSLGLNPLHAGFLALGLAITNALGPGAVAVLQGASNAFGLFSVAASVALGGAVTLLQGLGLAASITLGAVGTFVSESIGFYGILRDRGLSPLEAAFVAVGNAIDRLLGIDVSPWFATIGEAANGAYVGLKFLVDWLWNDGIPSIGRSVGAFVGAILDLIGALSRTVTTAAETIGDIGRAIGGALGAIARWFRDAGNAVGGLAGSIVGAFSGMYGDFYGFGRDVVQGLIDGMASLIPDLRAVAGEIAGLLAEVVSGILKLRSPSRVMFRIGQLAAAGLVLGVDDMVPAVERSAARMAGALTATPAAVPVRAVPSLAGLGGGTGGGNAYTLNVRVEGATADDAALAERVASVITRKIAAVEAGAAPV